MNTQLYADFPDPLKRYNTYRMRAFGYYAGRHGVAVINNVRWDSIETWPYCYRGIEKDSIVAIDTVASNPWILDNRPLFEEGLREMARVLTPRTIIVVQPNSAELRQQRGTPPASIYLSTGWLSCETFINVELLWGYGHARYDFTIGYAKRGLKADRDLSRSEVESLLSAFQASRAWEWETHYKNPGVLDGEHWSLLVRYADGYAFESEGSNNWPDEFLVIYEAMRDLGMMRYGRAGELPGYYRRYDPSERNYILQ